MDKNNTGTPYKCSFCGAPMSFNEFVCKNCWTDINGNKVNKELYAGEIQKDIKENFPVEEENEDIEYTCSNCGAELKKEDTICPKCGADVTEIEEADENEENIIELTCSNCGAVLSADDDVCPECGGEVVKDENEMQDLSETVVLRTYNNKFEAEMVKELLESQGIEAYVSVDDEGGMLPSLLQRGARLLVMDYDLDRAEEILNAPGEEIDKGLSPDSEEPDENNKEKE